LRLIDSVPTHSATSARFWLIASPAWAITSTPVPQMRWTRWAGTSVRVPQ